MLVENLPPGSPVTLHSLHHSEDKDYWESYGHYVSDHKGIVSGEFLSFVSHVSRASLSVVFLIIFIDILLRL